MDNHYPYTMSIDLSVLNHLGIGLYSNVPAVLSEAVANAWDADATEVQIVIDQSEITIQDNGFGMTKRDINHKYLKVGYRKREHEPARTPRGRHPMGRKGIGKLSVFSIADTIDVWSVRTGEVNGLRMSREAIEDTIKGKGQSDYHPRPLNNDRPPIVTGTKLLLKDLKKQVSTTEVHLRRRLARRFSIIGKDQEFIVTINGEEITARDRDFLRAVEFLWILGDENPEIIKQFPSLRKHFMVSNTVDTERNFSVTGWIATVDDQKHIDEQNNSIVVFAHGKLIHEDILGDLKEAGIYSKYVIGEIDADFMDLDNEEDIVTSNRQSVKEDDRRYLVLKEYVRKNLKTIQNEWTGLRHQAGVERALRVPVVKEWYETLEGDNKKYAGQLFGKIESLRIDDEDAKKELYKSSLLAFEKMALTKTLSLLDSIETEQDFSLLQKLFDNIDDIEAVHYYQIVKGRLAVIRDFERMLPLSKERALQQHIFDHLWLLHPSWERASSNQRVEEAVTAEFARIGRKLTKDEKLARIDIRYKTAAGKHIIVELKKYDRKVTATALVDQVRKYRDALEKCLIDKFPSEPRTIEIICILGAPPEPRNRPDENNQILNSIGARYVTYDTLIAEAQESYEEYLQRDRQVSKLIGILDRIDAEFSSELID